MTFLLVLVCDGFFFSRSFYTFSFKRYFLCACIDNIIRVSRSNVSDASLAMHTRTYYGLCFSSRIMLRQNFQMYWWSWCQIQSFSSSFLPFFAFFLMLVKKIIIILICFGVVWNYFDLILMLKLRKKSLACKEFDFVHKIKQKKYERRTNPPWDRPKSFSLCGKKNARKIELICVQIRF